MADKKIILSLFFIFCATFSIAQGKWINLFNGKDLSGWKQLNGKAKYQVFNGEIVGTTVFKEPNSFLVTDQNYGDFIIELEFRLDAEMNSGIQLRVCAAEK